jgi:hypothetical protein
MEAPALNPRLLNKLPDEKDAVHICATKAIENALAASGATLDIKDIYPEQFDFQKISLASTIYPTLAYALRCSLYQNIKSAPRKLVPDWPSPLAT